MEGHELLAVTRAVHAPESLTTQRLHLRRPTATDLDDVFHRYAADPVVTKYLSWLTHRTLTDTRAFLAMSDDEWRRGPAGAYLVFSRTDGSLLGSTALSFESPTSAITGHVFAQDAWRKGYATEVLTAMVALAATLGAERLAAGCHANHAASQRVLEKCCFVRESRRAQSSGFPNLGPSETQDLFVYAIGDVQRSLGLDARSVRVVPSDPRWAALYDMESQRIRAIAEELRVPLSIEHTGSTAVPGLAAKPVLDILAGLHDEADRAAAIDALERAGYDHRGAQARTRGALSARSRGLH